MVNVDTIGLVLDPTSTNGDIDLVGCSVRTGPVKIRDRNLLTAGHSTDCILDMFLPKFRCPDSNDKGTSYQFKFSVSCP